MTQFVARHVIEVAYSLMMDPKSRRKLISAYIPLATAVEIGLEGQIGEKITLNFEGGNSIAMSANKFTVFIQGVDFNKVYGHGGVVDWYFEIFKNLKDQKAFGKIMQIGTLTILLDLDDKSFEENFKEFKTNFLNESNKVHNGFDDIGITYENNSEGFDTVTIGAFRGQNDLEKRGIDMTNIPKEFLEGSGRMSEIRVRRELADFNESSYKQFHRTIQDYYTKIWSND